MKHWLDQVEQLWCHTMHTQVMWPVNGEYRCRVCLRSYPVPFAAPDSPSLRGHLLLHEAHVEN